MTTGIHPVTMGLMVHLTDDQEPNLELVTKEVTIPQLAEPVGSPDQDEPGWGDS